MPLDLHALVAPAQTALLMMECQEGIVGSGGKLGALAEAVARHGTIDRIQALLAAARRAGVKVFHLTMARRPDGAGALVNCRLLAATKKSANPLVLGSPQQAVVARLAPSESDYVIVRYHGLTPFHGTELDQLLRNLGVRTVVATGVSVNIGIPGLTLEAVNAGYQVVIPRDAVTGTPDSHVASMFEHTLGLLATVTATDVLIAAWSAAA